MLAHKVENATISELVSVYQEKSSEKYNEYCQAVRGNDESLKDKSYKEWAHADDCLLSLNKVLEMLRCDNL